MFEESKKKLNKLLEKKVIVEAENYSFKSKKEVGASEGNFVTKDGKTSLMKPVNTEPPTDQKIKGDRDDMIAEEMTASLYQLYLYEYAPNVGIAKYKKPDQPETNQWKDKVMSTSEFLDDFTSLKDLNPSLESKKNIRNFEKVIAVSTFLGDGDFHSENIGVIKKEENGQEFLVAAKIDHGRSRIFPSSEKEMRRLLSDRIAKWNYDGMPLNVNKFIEAIDSIENVSSDQIESHIRFNSRKLRNSGLELSPIFAGKSLKLNNSVTQKPSFEKLEQFYIDNLSKQKEIFASFKKTLETISKIDAPQEWKNGQWIHDLKRKDPVDWAIEQSYTIEGMDAAEWREKQSLSIKVTKFKSIPAESQKDVIEELSQIEKKIKTLDIISIGNNSFHSTIQNKNLLQNIKTRNNSIE